MSITTAGKASTIKGNCGRCFMPTPATSEETLSFGSSRYALLLCDPCADAFQRDMFAWARAGRIDDSDLGPSRAPKGSRGTVLVSHLSVPVARASEDQDAQVLPLRVKQVILDESGLPDGWDRWVLTEHAMDRRESRFVSPVEAKVAAAAPDIVRPGREADLFVHIKGHVQVVVNPTQHRIITVINRNITREQEEILSRKPETEMLFSATTR